MEKPLQAPPTSDSRPLETPASPSPRRAWQTPRLQRAAIDLTKNTPGALADGITTSSLLL